jgi:alpha,alpha-trehalase
MDYWKLKFNYNQKEEPKQEALCVLGNGYFATRGAAEESHDDDIHYPGTYLAGGFNRMESEVAGKIIENEDFVNWPNWLVLSFKPEGGEWLDLDKLAILS